jgi:uncharacterized protein YxeA
MNWKIKQAIFMVLAILLAIILIYLSISSINLLTGYGFTWTRNDYQTNEVQENQDDFDYNYQLGGGNPLGD